MKHRLLLLISVEYKALNAFHNELMHKYHKLVSLTNHLSQMLAYDTGLDRSATDLLEYYGAVDKRDAVYTTATRIQQQLNSFSILTELRKFIKL